MRNARRNSRLCRMCPRAAQAIHFPPFLHLTDGQIALTIEVTGGGWLLCMPSALLNDRHPLNCFAGSVACRHVFSAFGAFVPACCIEITTKGGFYPFPWCFDGISLPQRGFCEVRTRVHRGSRCRKQHKGMLLRSSVFAMRCVFPRGFLRSGVGSPWSPKEIACVKQREKSSKEEG